MNKRIKLKKHIGTFLLRVQPILLLPFAFSIGNFNLNIEHSHDEILESHNKDSNLESFTKSSSIALEDNQNYLTNFDITPIHKTGKDKMVWLIYAEGYTKDQIPKFITEAKAMVNNIFNIEPYNEFSSMINFYAVNVISENEWVPGDNFGKTYLNSTSEGGILNLSYFGNGRLKFLNEQIVRNYLDPGARIIENTVMINSDSYFRAANSMWFSVILALSDEKFRANVAAHEAAHGFANLGDEYSMGVNANSIAPNRTLVSNLNEIPWKEFVGYKGVGAFPVDKNFIPTDWCLMRVTNNHSSKFCPVCTHRLYSILNSYSGNVKKYFVDDIELELTYNERGNPNGIKYRTMFHNYNRNEKMELKIQFESIGSKNETYESNLTIEPNEIKQLSGEKIIRVIGNKIIVKLIDQKTNEILTYGSYDWKTVKKEKIKYYNVTTNFKNVNTNENIQKINTTTFKIKENSNHILTPPEINGYRYVKSSQLNNKINNINSDISVDYFYEPVNKKILNMLIKNENGTTLYTKEFDIFENQKKLITTRDDYIFDRTKKLEPLKKEYKYEELNDKQNIEYIVKENKPIIEVKKATFNVFPYGKRPSINDIVNLYKLNGEQPSDNGNLEYEDYKVNWNEPGTYEMTLWYKDKVFSEKSDIIWITTQKKVTITILKNGEIDDSKVKATNFMSNHFVDSYSLPTKDNADKIVQSKREYDNLTQSAKSEVDLIIKSNSNFSNKKSYMEIFNEVNNFITKLENLLRTNLFFNGSYVTNVNSDTYKMIQNFETKFNQLPSNEKDFLDFKLGKSYLTLLNESKKYEQSNNVNYPQIEKDTNNKKENLWLIITPSILIPIVLISIVLFFFFKKRNKNN